MLKIRQLEYFRAVMLCGSVSRAADYLCVSQPVVSKAIARIEDQIGLQLFNRTASSLVPTRHAYVINRYCDEVFHSTGKLEEAVEQLKSKPSGNLRFCAAPSLCNWLVPEVLALYDANIPIQFDSIMVKHVPASIESGLYDFAFTIWPIQSDKIDCRQISDGELVCICHKTNPLAALSVIDIEDLAGNRFVYTNRTAPIGDFIERQFKGRLDVPGNFIEVDRSDIACSIVNAGGGISIVNRHSFHPRHWPEVVPLRLNTPMRVGIYLATPRFAALDASAQSFIAFFCDYEKSQTAMQ